MRPSPLLLPDIIIDPVAGGDGCLKQLVDAHDDFGGIVLAVEEVPRERVSSYGIIDPGKTTGNRLEIRGMVEKPSADEAPSNLCITGRYILSTEIFDFLDKGVRGAGGEIQLTDAIADNLGKMPIHGVRFPAAALIAVRKKASSPPICTSGSSTRKSPKRSSGPRPRSCSSRADLPAPRP